MICSAILDVRRSWCWLWGVLCRSAGGLLLGLLMLGLLMLGLLMLGCFAGLLCCWMICCWAAVKMMGLVVEEKGYDVVAISLIAFWWEGWTGLCSRLACLGQCSLAGVAGLVERSTGCIGRGRWFRKLFLRLLNRQGRAPFNQYIPCF